MTKDYYKILGVDRGVDEATLKKAYRELVMEHHPDHGGDEEKFKEISEAYTVLSDPEKKANYDNPMRQMRGFPFGNPFGDMPPFRRPDPNAPRRGRNIVLEHAAPLRYFIFGGKLKVEFSFRDPCPDCSGTGAEEKETCSNCRGVGQVMESKQGQGIFIQSTRACPACSGRGFTASKQCEQCAGSGARNIDRSLELDVPRGTAEGQVIGMTGAGGTGLNGGPSGDLIVKLHMRMPNPDELTEEQVAVLKEI